MKWRVIMTDSEDLTGVAPECPSQLNHHLLEREGGRGNYRSDLASVVYDCCPGPHLECFSVDGAKDIAFLLNLLEVQVCS